MQPDNSSFNIKSAAATKMLAIESEMRDVSKDQNMWDFTDFPTFEGRNIFVLPGAFQGDVAQMFVTAGFGVVRSVEEADVVVFTGGVDVDPSLYGEKAIRETQTPNINRDAFEMDVFAKALSLGKVMVGICRGAQFLHVMNKGKLWQHVGNHAGPNHTVYDLEDMVYLEVSSIHHQMLRYDPSIMELVAVGDTQQSVVFKTEGEDFIVAGGRELEIESAIYLDTKCIVFQGHPEVGPAPYTAWTLDKIDGFLTDLENLEGVESVEESRDEEGPILDLEKIAQSLRQ